MSFVFWILEMQMTVWTGSEVGMRHKEAIWLSSPNFYSAVKQFVEEHQCGIAFFDTDKAIYSMQVLGLTQACRANRYQILHLQKLLACLAYSVHFQKNFISVQKQFYDQDRECGAVPST